MDIKRLCLKEKINAETQGLISRHLRKKYFSLLADMEKRYMSGFRIQPAVIDAPARGDIFTIDNKNFNFYYINEKYHQLEIGSFSLDEKTSETFDEFKEEVKKLVSAKHQGKATFEDISESPYFKYVKEEMTQFRMTPEELKIADELKDEFTRNIMNKIGGGTWLDEFAGFDQDALEQVLQKLEQYGLIKREYVVFCVETKAQIIRVSSYDIIKESHRRGFKCFSCGRMLDEERTNQFIILTDTGKRFAKKNFWIGYIIAAHFHQQLKKDLKVFYKEEIEKGSLDLIINYQSKLILLQINEDKIDLSDLYYFISKKKFYNVDYGVVFSLGKPDPLVEYFLRNKNAGAVKVFTSWNDFYGNIAAVLEEACAQNIADLLEVFSRFTPVKIDTCAAEFLASEPQNEIIKKIDKLTPKQGLKQAVPAEGEEEKTPVVLLAPSTQVPAMSAQAVQVLPAQEPSGEKPRMLWGPADSIREAYSATYTAADVLKNILSSPGARGKKDEICGALKKIGEVNSFSGALIDKDTGFCLYNRLEAAVPEEQLAPYFAEIFTRAAGYARKLSFGEALELYFDLNDKTVSLQDAGTHIIAVLNNNSGVKLIGDSLFENASAPAEYEDVKGVFFIETNGEPTAVKMKDNTDAGKIKDYIFNIYHTAQSYFAETNLGNINTIMARDAQNKIIARFGSDKIEVVVIGESKE